MDADQRVTDLEKRVEYLESLLSKAQAAMKKLEKNPMLGSIVKMFSE